MSLILADADNQDYKKIRRLYQKSFPLEERAPFFFVKQRVREKKARMLAVKDNGAFVGFAYLVCREELAYLFFFAVESEKRGTGYGSRALSLLKEEYRGKRLFLAREQLDRTAKNYGERVRRHEFYLRNGFSDLPCRLKEAGVVYDVMSIGGEISADEYDALISGWIGKGIRKVIDMRLIEGKE